MCVLRLRVGVRVINYVTTHYSASLSSIHFCSPPVQVFAVSCEQWAMGYEAVGLSLGVGLIVDTEYSGY